MSSGSTSPRRLSATKRQARALELRARGKTFQAIADELGYNSPQAAHKAVTTGLRKTLKEPSDELRTLEAERLDRMLEGIWEKAINGGTWEIDRVISIMDRRTRLLGLDKPSSDESDIAAKAQFYLDLVNSARAQAKDLSE